MGVSAATISGIAVRIYPKCRQARCKPPALHKSSIHGSHRFIFGGLI
jgi:hypothetical protein